MSRVIESIEAPVFLVAMPQVQDPFFNRAVVMVVEHHEQGSLGFIVNRPTEVALKDVLRAQDVEWPDDEARVFFGGPVQPQQGTVLIEAGDREGFEQSAIRIAPTMWLSQTIDDLRRVTGRNERFRVLLGYAGWGPGQLDQEMERNDWLLAPVDPGLVFSEESDRVWELALASIGIRPEQLPAWTQAVDPDKAN